MKTPRNLLLERHRVVAPKLDAIRQTALGAVEADCDRRESAGTGMRQRFPTAATAIFTVLWHELISPSRRLWSGLAATWILILAINAAQSDTVSSVTGKPVYAPAIAVNWQSQQRWMNELFADRAMPPDAERPKTDPTKPRTEWVNATAT